MRVFNSMHCVEKRTVQYMTAYELDCITDLPSPFKRFGQSHRKNQVFLFNKEENEKLALPKFVLENFIKN